MRGVCQGYDRTIETCEQTTGLGGGQGEGSVRGWGVHLVIMCSEAC